MNLDLIAKTLCFHGQPLQKIWEGERGNHDLARLGIINADYSIYMARQKNLTFQDRAKRLKLHQFLARQAPVLFDQALVEEIPGMKKKDKGSGVCPVVMPPYEAFLNKSIDKSKNIAQVLEAVQPGDIVYGMVTSRTPYGILIKALCTGEPVTRYLADINIKAYVVTQNLIPAVDKKGNPKQFNTNDYVCCEVLDVSADADRLLLGMKGTLTIDAKAPLGLITVEQLPEYYKLLISNDDVTFNELLDKSKGFQNPNCVDLLFQENGLDPNESFSNLLALRNRFPQEEYASELRHIQASKWAFRSVADGIEHFKVGRHSEAFQCLNKALNIDPRNVEGLVARGALYANSGSFKKAVDDFETALKLNPYHANARKYMGETLVALGRSYEEENRLDDARKAYNDCLTIIPHHEEAKSSLDFLNAKSGQGKQLIDASELVLPGLKLPGPIKKDRNEDAKKDKNPKKKKSKSRKRKDSSSSSSNDSSDSDSSSDSSSSSGSSSTSSDSDSSGPSSSNKRKLRGRKKSLSPLSKRMALMDEQNPAAGTTRYQFNQPFHLANQTSADNDDYDMKVRNFLNMTNEDEDYESRVRKLIEEASKHRKERKNVDEKTKRKEKQKQKKMKKESKKEKRRKEKMKTIPDLENLELKEALKILKSLPVNAVTGKTVKDDINEYEKYEKIVDLLQKRKDIPSTSKPTLKQYAFSEIETEEEIRGRMSAPIQKRPAAGASKKPATPPPVVNKRPTTPPPPSVAERPRLPAPIHITIPKQPVVLDKFGSFRLAAFDDPKETIVSNRKSASASPPARSPSQYRRRGSRSPPRRRYSRSRSPSQYRRRGSRSPRRRYSRSRSPSQYRRRGSRSPRRRYSRSRSPSRYRRRRSRSYDSPDRRRRISRSRSDSSSDSRSPGGSRRRGGGGSSRRGSGYRGTRGRGFRGTRGGGRGRGGPGGYRGRKSPFFHTSNVTSFDERGNLRRDGGSSDDGADTTDKKKGTGNGRGASGIDGKWTHDKYEKTKSDYAAEENWDEKVDPTIEEIEKIIGKAQKERKQEIIQRDKDLLKKPLPNNLPFVI